MTDEKKNDNCYRFIRKGKLQFYLSMTDRWITVPCQPHVTSPKIQGKIRRKKLRKIEGLFQSWFCFLFNENEKYISLYIIAIFKSKSKSQAKVFFCMIIIIHHQINVKTFASRKSTHKYHLKIPRWNVIFISQVIWSNILIFVVASMFQINS